MPLWVAVDGCIVGVIEITDKLRKSATGLGRKFKDLGIGDVFLATGDREKAEAGRVAAIIGADSFQSSMAPADKTALVRKMAGQGGVVMIGDGVNDAAAMAAQTWGFPWVPTRPNLPSGLPISWY